MTQQQGRTDMTDEQIGKVVIAKLEEHQPSAWRCKACGRADAECGQNGDAQACLHCGALGALDALYTVGDIRAALRPVPLARALELLGGGAR